jgi:predicted flap endonuclease-1-like 5' DNA nuclease
MYKLEEIQGLGEAYAAKLKELGVTSAMQLLEAARTRVGRSELAQKLGVDDRVVLEWANRADLMRLKGVAGRFSDLLEHAGIDSAIELARRVPENLHTKMAEVNAANPLVQRLPTLDNVKDWVEQAKNLGRAVEH